MTDVRIMWPFDVNWDSSYRITYAFKTDIIVKRAGGEQRRALRSTPRKSLEFTILAAGDELRAFKRILATGQNMPIVMPEVTRRAATATASASGATELEIAGDMPAWLFAGAEVVLIAGTDRRVAAVESIAGDTVTFADPVGAWPAGTLVHPALTGFLADEISAPRASNAVALAGVQFDVEPASETYDPAGAEITLGGRDVFDLAPNWREKIDVKGKWPSELVDFGFGRIVRHRPVDFPTRLSQATYLRRDVAEAEALLDAFLRAKGKRGAFLLSTAEPDLVPIADLVSAASTFRVAGEDVFDAYAEDPVHAAIAVHLANGTVLYRFVVSMAVDTGDTVVTVAGTWGQNVALADILAISWLLNTRFASDDMTIEWLTDSVAQAKLSFQSLPAVEGSDYLALRATVEGDDRETVAGDDRAVIYFPVS